MARVPDPGGASGCLRDVAAATVSSWENTVAPKLAPPERLKAYAQFFATHRSIEVDASALLPVDPTLLPVYTAKEQAACKALEDELLTVRDQARKQSP
jgi:hypothetical protein